MKNTVSIKGKRTIIVPPFIINDMKAHELGRELYIKNIAFFPKVYFHSCECSGKDAEDYTLIYCVDGKGWLCMDNRKYLVKRDQLMIIPKNKEYIYGSDRDAPWTTYWIRFNGEKADYFSKGKCQPITISRNAVSKEDMRLNVFEKIYSALSSGCEINNLLYTTTVFFHFLGVVKFLNDDCECSKKEAKKMDIIDIAIHYMRENMTRMITLSEVASHVGLSESYFSAVFAKKTGSSPLRYLANLRFEQACHYLNSTDMKVNQICPLVGYDDSLYFSRVFSKTMGMPPSKYRMHKIAN